MGSNKIAKRIRVYQRVKTEIIRKVQHSRVAVGDLVAAEDIVGEKKITKDHFVDVGRAVTKVNLGDSVSVGSTLAVRASVFGLSKKLIVSPVDGAVTGIKPSAVTVTEKTGSLEVSSGCWGKVIMASADEVRILTAADEYIGAVGIGLAGEGFVKRVATPSEILTPTHITSGCSGCIILGGSLVLPDAIEKAAVVGAKGIVCGGIHYRDYLALVKKETKIPLILTEGFGALVQTLEIPEGFGIIAPDQKKLVVPVNVSEDKWQDRVEDEQTSIDIKEKMFVRICALDFFGKIGQVISISDKMEQLESGLLSTIVSVSIGEKVVKVALQNLEAI